MKCTRYNYSSMKTPTVTSRQTITEKSPKFYLKTNRNNCFTDTRTSHYAPSNRITAYIKDSCTVPRAEPKARAILRPRSEKKMHADSFAELKSSSSSSRLWRSLKKAYENVSRYEKDRESAGIRRKYE